MEEKGLVYQIEFFSFRKYIAQDGGWTYRETSARIFTKQEWQREYPDLNWEDINSRDPNWINWEYPVD